MAGNDKPPGAEEGPSRARETWERKGVVAIPDRGRLWKAPRQNEKSASIRCRLAQHGLDQP